MKGTVPFFKSSDESPTLSAELLVEGRKNYEISCAVCHGFSGHGNGLVTQRGYPRPTDFSAPSECQLSNESLFQVISSGKDEMPPFAAKLNSHERWSVVHYVRALQLHDHFPARFLSVEERRRLEKSSR
jgi:mono/diheme cytochrome c family protein